MPINWLDVVKNDNKCIKVGFDELQQLLDTKVINRYSFTDYQKHSQKFDADADLEYVIRECKELCRYNRQLFNVWCKGELVVVTPEDNEFYVNIFED